MSVIGLDLGTAHARVAVVGGQGVSLLHTPSGAAEVPCVVSYVGGVVRAGDAALRHVPLHPEDTVRALRGHLGKGAVTVAGVERNPVDVAAVLVAHLLREATPQLGGRPTAVVATGPAWFQQAQSLALRRVLERAGLEVLRVLLEPSALGLYLLARSPHLRRVAIVDAGTGGASFAVVRFGSRQVVIEACVGDGQAGGRTIVEHLVSQVHERHRGVEAVPRASQLELTREACEAAMRDLLHLDSATFPAPHLLDESGESSPLVTVTRHDLETAAAPLCARIETGCRTLRKCAAGSFDAIVVAGSMGQFDFVRAAIERGMGEAPLRGVAPVGAVAQGAAVLADAIHRGARAIHVDERSFRASSGAADPDVPHGAASVPATDPPSESPIDTPLGGSVPGSVSHAVQRSGAGMTMRPTAPDARVEQRVSDPGLPEVRCPETSPSVSDSASQSQGAVLPREPGSGDAVNPTTAEQVLALPLNRPLETPDLDPVALPVLFARLIARRHVSGTLRLQSTRGNFRFPVVAGCPYLRTLERVALPRAFTWPRLSYSFEMGSPETGGREPTKVVHLIVEGLKLVGRGFTTDALEAALGSQLEQAPTIRPERQRFVHKLGLERRELRIVENMDGRYTGIALAHLGLGHHSTLQVLVLLSLFGFLEWRQPQPKEKGSMAAELLERADWAEKANHFDALGAHWSCSPEEFIQAHDRVLREVAEGTRADDECPDACRRIRARAQTAIEVLSDPEALRAYQAQVLPHYDFEALDDLMIKRMRALEMKRDERELASTRHARQVIAMVSSRPTRE